MKSNELREKREIEASEAKDKAAKIISGLIPYGSQAYDLVTTIVVPLHEKKKREFIEDLAKRIYKLESEGKIDLDELAESEEFNTIITKAILLAQQNHQKEKLEALKAIVIHTATNLNKDTLAFEERIMFLRITDQIETTHLRVLKFLIQPNAYVNDMGMPNIMFETKRPSKILSLIHPELSKNLDLLEQVWLELYNFGLVNSRTSSTQITSRNPNGSSNLISKLGERFFELIKTNL